jgi:hypothetical protein
MNKLPEKIKNVLSEQLEVLYTIRRQVTINKIDEDTKKNIDKVIGNILIILTEYFGVK